jgi:hypothetical protein
LSLKIDLKLINEIGISDRVYSSPFFKSLLLQKILYIPMLNTHGGGHCTVHTCLPPTCKCGAAWLLCRVPSCLSRPDQDILHGNQAEANTCSSRIQTPITRTDDHIFRHISHVDSIFKHLSHVYSNTRIQTHITLSARIQTHIPRTVDRIFKHISHVVHCTQAHFTCTDGSHIQTHMTYNSLIQAHNKCS